MPGLKAARARWSVAPGSAVWDGREEVLVLRVRDDGRGFDTGDSSARSRGSVGLELLSSIVASHGGTLTVEAALGQGTELILTVPLGPITVPSMVAQEQEQKREQDIARALR